MSKPGPNVSAAIDRAHQRLMESIPPIAPAVQPPTAAAPVRLALGRNEAAAALGISVTHFQRLVQPEVRCVYAGRKRLYPVKELELWLERNQGARPAGG